MAKKGLSIILAFVFAAGMSGLPGLERARPDDAGALAEAILGVRDFSGAAGDASLFAPAYARLVATLRTAAGISASFKAPDPPKAANPAQSLLAACSGPAWDAAAALAPLGRPTEPASLFSSEPLSPPRPPPETA
jgi:hypothetical protein